MNIGDLYETLGAIIDGNPKAKILDCFVSIDFGDGKHSRLYDIDEISNTNDEDVVLVVKAWKQ